MNSLTVSAHLTPDTESVIRVHAGPDRISEAPFVSLRVGGSDVDVVFLADLDTSEALRNLAAAATEAADALDAMAADAPEVISRG